MPSTRGAVPSRELRVLYGPGSRGGRTDGHLLEQFVMRRDEAGELAFATLMDRHGPMVLRTCRGLLRDPNDAEDAFQATFLVLARRAGSLRVDETVGPWLHRVACRIAARNLADRARHARHERRAAERSTTVAGPEDPDDLGPVLHEEIDQLPGRFRSPIVLCYLEGLTHDQAASRLGWPVGTVRSRLSRGRDRLRDRLSRRGVAPAMPLRLGATGPRPPATIRPSLALTTTRAAARIAGGTTSAAGVTPAVVALTRGALRTMIRDKLIKIAAGVLAAGLATSVAAAFVAGDPPAATARPSSPAAASPPPRTARPEPPAKTEAETIAEATLKAGSDLYDAKDAPGLAATYTEDGEIHLIAGRDEQHRDELKRGRFEVEQFYRDLFRNAASIDSENTVEFARLIDPDLLVIHGRFRPNVGEPALPFIQIRTKQGDKWLLSKLWLFLKPEGL